MAENHSDEQLVIRRRLYTQVELDSKYPAITTERTSLSSFIRHNCRCTKKRIWNVLTTFLPVINFIGNYKIRQNVLGDFLSGLTVSFMHLPQGLGFGILAGLQPVNGLYSTFFPVVFYMLFGTSPHVSFGTNAVIALLTQSIVQRETDLYISRHSLSSENATTVTPMDNDLMDFKVGVAMTSSLLVGLILASLGILRLGFLTLYLSTSFVGAFTTAAAFHIASSQLPAMFGIHVGSFSGAGKLVRFYIDFFSNIHNTVPAEIIIALSCFIVLLLVKVCINEKYKSKMKMPIPIDLIVVILATCVSHFADFHGAFDVRIVGNIQAGMPVPRTPSLDSAGRIISDCVVIAVLSLAMTITMAKVTAAINDIQIDDNQELIAYGVSNAASSFFHCFPQSTGPPRTMLLSSLNSKTTLNAIPTAVFILLVILWIGQLFQSLPVSVLAAMIVVAIKDLLLQFRKLPSIYRINKYDFVTWVLTCLVSILVDLSYGIIAGIAVSIILVVVQHQLASGKIIELSNIEDIFVNKSHNKNVIPGVTIFQFQAPVYFANAERFKKQLYSLCGDPVALKTQASKQGKSSFTNAAVVHENDVDVQIDVPASHDVPSPVNLSTTDSSVKHIIVDCQMFLYIDLAGIGVLQQINKDYKSVGITVMLTRCPSKCLETLEAAEFYKVFPKQNVFYDNIDAVESIRRKINLVQNASNI